MAFTPADGGAEPPPAALQTAGKLPFAGRHQNLAQHVHQVQSTSRPSHNNQPEIQNVLGPIGNTSKSITPSTSHSISDRHKKASKTRKNNKSRSRFLSPHRSESETVFSATSGTPFQSRASSSSQPSSNRSATTSKTEKKFKSNSRSSSPSRSESEAAILLTGNGAGQQLHPTAHQPFSDLPPPPSGTSGNQQLQPQSGITTAACGHDLAGAKPLPKLAPPHPVVTGTKDSSLLSAKPRSDAFTVAAVNGHDGASSSAGAAVVAGATELSAMVLDLLPMILIVADKLKGAGSISFASATTLAAAARAKQLTKLATSAHDPEASMLPVNDPKHSHSRHHLNPATETAAVQLSKTAPARAHGHAGTPASAANDPVASVLTVAGNSYRPTFPSPAHESDTHSTISPDAIISAKGNEQLRPALKIQKIHNPNANRVATIQTHDPKNLAQTRAHPEAQTLDPSTLIQTQTRDPSIQAQTQTCDPLIQAQTRIQTQTRDPPTQAQQPITQLPAHNSKSNFNKTQTFAETSSNPPKHSYASILNPTSTFNPNNPLHPPKTFSDVVSGQKDSTIPLKPVSLKQGEPAVIFSTEEIAAMAEPFKLALIGKFSFGRPSMDIIRKFFISLGLKGTSHISLLDNRHILIKLSLEDDYSRIWVRQTWYINGRGMRVFKWSKDFRCSAESPIVPVWVSLPHLPVHFIFCKAALYSIAAAIGTPLRVDNATASGTRPSVARILVEYDISQPLLPRIWIGEGDSGFWQDVIFEKVPAYCSACRHLGHSSDSCFIANPGLRKAPQSTAPSQRPAADSEQPAASADERVHTASDMPQDTHVDDICLLGPPTLRDIPHTPDMSPEPSSLAIQIVESGSPITMIPPVEVDTSEAALVPLRSDFVPHVGMTAGHLIYRETPPWDPYRHQGRFYRSSSWQTTSSCDTFPDDAAPICTLNTHCTDVPEVIPATNTSKDRIGKSHRIEDYSNSSDEVPVDVRCGNSDSEIMEEAIIEKLGGQRIVTSTEGFTEVTPRKGFKMNRRRRRF